MTTLYDLGAVTVAGYRIRTGDSTTAASAVTGALVEAEMLLEEELRRELALQSRSESMRIRDRDGRMYPKAWPITACASNVIEGNRTLLGGTPDLAQFTALIDVALPQYATITYTGGFDSTTLPITLRDAIYDLARAVVAERIPIPVGATSASVGDVSVSFGESSESGIDSYVSGISDRVRKYRNRWV